MSIPWTTPASLALARGMITANPAARVAMATESTPGPA